MSYEMTFKGALAFRQVELGDDRKPRFRADEAAIARALDAVGSVSPDPAAAVGTLISRSDFTRVGDKLRLAVDVVAPAGLWDPTLAVLRAVREHASDGRVLCSFPSDGDEAQLEIIAAGPHWDPDQCGSGPFPAAFLGTLDFEDAAQATAAVRAFAELLASSGRSGHLSPKVQTRSVRVEERRACHRQGWWRLVSALEVLARGARGGAVDTQIKHNYLPDGELVHIGARANATHVWD